MASVRQRSHAPARPNSLLAGPPQTSSTCSSTSSGFWATASGATEAQGRPVPRLYTYLCMQPWHRHQQLFFLSCSPCCCQRPVPPLCWPPRCTGQPVSPCPPCVPAVLFDAAQLLSFLPLHEGRQRCAVLCGPLWAACTGRMGTNVSLVWNSKRREAHVRQGEGGNSLAGRPRPCQLRAACLVPITC